MYSFLKRNQKEFFDFSNKNQESDREIILSLIEKVEQITEIVVFNLMNGGNLGTRQ